MTRILGVDFSGAQDAGRKIWIAEARKSDGPLAIERCLAAEDLPESGRSPAAALAALARHVIAEPDTIAGCDFPFSLPLALVGKPSWRDFALGFETRFPDPEAFRLRCWREAGGHEIKRATDKEDRTPFNSYNLRLYRQTWWGIARLLAPLLRADAARVRPQMPLRAGKPVLVEVCAASTLIWLDCYPSYKGRSLAHRRARRRILEHLVGGGYLSRPSPRLAALLLGNAGGDALDAVIGAIAANRADLGGATIRAHRLEGCVYFRL